MKSGLATQMTSNAPSAVRRWRGAGPRLSETAWAYAFVAPQLVGLIAFTAFPIVMSGYLAFAEWDFVRAPTFVGAANIEGVLGDELFYTAIGNTLVLVAGIVPLTTGLALALALVTVRTRRSAVYRAAFFLPIVTSTVAIAIVWYWLYAPDFGLINAVLGIFGITGPGWLADPAWAKPAIVLMVAWQSFGFFYLLFLAGLKAIPGDYYEAAAIDGAGERQLFRHITLPLLSPTTFFVIVTMLISSFTIFNEAYVLTRGGPAFSTYTIVMHIYNLAFQYFRMGEAAVVSWVLFGALFLLTALQFRVSRRWVHYGE